MLKARGRENKEAHASGSNDNAPKKSHLMLSNHEVINRSIPMLLQYVESILN